MKNLSLKSILLCIMCLVVLFTGCSKKGATAEKKTIAFITNNTADFWIIAQRGCEKAQTELPNYNVDFRLTSDATPAEQRRIIDDLLAKGVAGIAISPIDPVNQKPFIDTLAGQIAVITCDSDIPDSKRLCYIGTDNVAAGRQAGQLIKEVLPDGGKIMLFVGKRDVQNAKERIQGIEETLEGTNIDIIDVRTDNTDQVQAKSNVADALVKYPDLACCVGLWSYNGPAILNAVSDAGKLGQVKIVTFDEEDETLAGVRDGYIYGTVVQQPFEFGHQSTKATNR
jgi:ribose transport system substrate-binding protein